MRDRPAPTLAQLLRLDLPESEVPKAGLPDYFSVLVEGSALMLRGCGPGCVPVLWWSTWSPLEKRALADAADRIKAEDALVQGLASQGPSGTAAVAARFDGGQAFVQNALRGLLERSGRGRGK